jgi:putative oxygen-independent coproporphyrinogen III oxidase
LPPLSLYLHFPWCIRKCPYCDFSSFAVSQEIPEQEYLAALLADLTNDLELVKDREIRNIFLGGGTPSLFSPRIISELITNIKSLIAVAADAEISMEINPGTVIPDKLSLLFKAGINRLSIGVQSFQNEKLQVLNRIHDAQQAIDTVNAARAAGFENFNIDLMFGLPEQTVADAIFDLETAAKLQPTHLSWYQLTLEPGTVFGNFPPAFMPEEEQLGEIQKYGNEFLVSSGFEHYEISAYCKSGKYCRHNLNYWQFGDYLGIGAGAHGKITSVQPQFSIVRKTKFAKPEQYLAAADKGEIITVAKQELLTEFMLNALRLLQPIPLSLFSERTGLALKEIEPQLLQAETKGLLEITAEHIITTELGRRFLNQLLTIF